MIKMVVTDIDGTILSKSGIFSKKIKDTFKNLIANNVKTVLATGRMFCATLPLAKELGIVEPLITYQGGFIKEPFENGKILRQILLERNLTFDILEKIKKENLHINLYTNDTLYVENDNALIKQYCDERNITYTVLKNFKELDFAGVHKLLAIDNDSEKISNLIEKLSQEFANQAYITHSTPYFCEISSPKANKGDAIKFLANHWNIKKEEILCSGDQNNDIELLENGGIKVAMGNASTGLKQVADFVSDTVENDGFALAIDKFVFER